MINIISLYILLAVTVNSSDVIVETMLRSIPDQILEINF